MACTGCNDGCFDESVQLQSGPQGVAGTNGTNGADGADGVDGVAVIQANVSVASTTSNSYATGAIQSDTINGTTIDFGTVDDILKMKFTIIGDTVEVATPDYHWKVEYGADTIIDSSVSTIFKLMGDSGLSANGCDVELDLVISATDTIVPILRFYRSTGLRTSKLLLSTTNLNSSSLFSYTLPAVAIGSPISGNNNLVLSVRNSDNSSTVDIVNYELIKYLK